MESPLQNKLLQYEVAPPATVWEKISGQLDQEFIPADAMLSMKMEKASVAPPSHSWDNIAATLHPKSSSKVIPIVYKRIAVAAIVAGLIALSAVYFLNDNNSAQINNTVALNSTSKSPGNASPSTQSYSPNTTGKEAKAFAAITQERSSAKRSYSKKNIVTSVPPYLTYAELELEPAPVRTVADIQQPVEVEAPPIRDARGNIIMDYSVISKPNDPYITITSPSGIQTKISNKFLHCLSYLNSDASSSETGYDEGMEWKNKFEEWRNKLLSEGAFVPAASNFFDIFELKALIEE